MNVVPASTKTAQSELDDDVTFLIFRDFLNIFVPVRETCCLLRRMFLFPVQPYAKAAHLLEKSLSFGLLALLVATLLVAVVMRCAVWCCAMLWCCSCVVCCVWCTRLSVQASVDQR